MMPTYRPYIGNEEIEAVTRVLNSRWLGMGKLTEQFEQELSRLLCVKHVVAVNSGTAALHLALDALDLSPADQVITPSLTFAATVQAIRMTGAKVVFCEVSDDTLNADVADIERQITPDTKAILPVHFGGWPCRIDEIVRLAKDHSLAVIEDAAHAFGSAYKGKMIGSLGDATCFSFDPIKNITCGGGGAVATNSDRLADTIRLRRYLGMNRTSWDRLTDNDNWKYDVTTLGFRYHMNDINAAIGLAQLGRLAEFKEIKQKIVRTYDRAFGPIRGLRLINGDIEQTFPFGYFIRVLGGRRDTLITYLKDRNISTRVQFIPNHIQPAFADYHRPLPITERIYAEIVTLPLYYDMTEADVAEVIAAVSSFCDESDPPGQHCFSVTDEP